MISWITLQQKHYIDFGGLGDKKRGFKVILFTMKKLMVQKAHQMETTRKALKIC